MTAVVAMTIGRWRGPTDRPAILAFYGSAWQLPFGVALVAAATLETWLLDRPFFSCLVPIPQIGRIDLYDLLVSFLMIIPPGLAGWRAAVHLRGAIRAVRHANA